jgi:hypothetical protein
MLGFTTVEWLFFLDVMNLAKNIRPLPAPGRVANPMSQVIFQTTSKDGNDIML